MGIADDLQGLASRLVEPLRGWFAPAPIAPSVTSPWGTYTPTYYGGTTVGVTTWTVGFPTGSYLLIGPLCFVYGQLVWTNQTGTGEGRLGMPFTAAANTPLLIRPSSYTWTNTQVMGLILGGQSYARIESVSSAGAAAAEPVRTSGNIVFSAVYEVSV